MVPDGDNLMRKGEEGSIGCLQKQYAQKIGCWSKIWRSVAYALPPIVWLQIGLVSYVMAHSETELYGLVMKGIWKRMKWWRKPAALSVEWCGSKFVWYYKYIRYVWNMFCFLVKVVSGWFLMMLNLESF